SLCVISNVAQGDIYSFTDANGAQSFSNVPTDERYILMLRTDEVKELVQSDVHINKNLNRTQQRFFAPEISRAAMIYHLDPALLHAVIATESGYEVNAVSRKGAMGLMQLM